MVIKLLTLTSQSVIELSIEPTFNFIFGENPIKQLIFRANGTYIKTYILQVDC